MPFFLDESRWSRAGGIESNYWKGHFKKYGVMVHIVNSIAKTGNEAVDGMLNS